jgi:putative SOS response-associated peptidase YedK
MVGEIHDRMPVILAPERYDAWLAPTPQRADVFLPWLAPCPAEWLEAYPVSDLVSSPAHDEPACIAPL